VIALFVLTADPRRRAAGKDAALAGYVRDLAEAMLLTRVVVVLLGAKADGEEAQASIAGVPCHIVHLRAPSRLGALAHLLACLLRREPVVLGQVLFLSARVAARVRAVAAQCGAALTVLDTIRCYTADVGERGLMLYDDLFSLRYAADPPGDAAQVFGRYRDQIGRLAPLALLNRLAGALRRWEARLCARKEAYVAARMPGLILNATEANLLAALPGAKPVFAYVPDVAEAPSPDRHRGADPFWLFVGALAHGPNRQALGWLADEVLPRYRALGGVAQAWVAGGGEPPPLLDPQVRLLGRVDNLRPLYDTCLGVLAPVSSGSGIRVKLVEALAFACPVIATPVSCAGFETAPAGVTVAETGAAFAEAMRAAETGATANLEARDWYERSFGPERIGRLQAMLA
jgi:hypothetical protein